MVALLPALLFWPAAAEVDTAEADTLDTDSVSVRVAVEPIAEVSFPAGRSFRIVVPDHDGHAGKDGEDCDEQPDARGRGKGSRAKHESDDDGCSERGGRDDSYDDGRGAPHFGWGDGHDDAWVRPPVVPFIVRGNASASVSVRPDAFLAVVRGGETHYLGRAEKMGSSERELGYNLVVQFPLPVSWPRPHHELVDFGSAPAAGAYATLPLDVAEGTPELAADMAAFDRRALGLIYLFSAADWTPSGERARPGAYAGTVEITVTAGD